ncbi:MAG TPA: type VI secretion system contractile sheath protein TssC, partial [Bacteroidia bacterium]|nr:type VI secretion system contractile sheath protein TssC [Bacteroidia bacterium]
MEESQQQQQQQQNQTKERERVANPAQVIEESANKLAKFGGFDILEAVIDGVQNLNPERKAR